MPHIAYFLPPGYPKPLSVPPPEFVPQRDVSDYLYNESQLRSRTTLTAQTFFAPVYLPHGATVTKLTLYGYRSTAGSFLELSLKHISRTGAPNTMANLMALWEGGAGSVYDDTINDPVIDNENYQYALVLNIDPDTTVEDCYFYCAAIDWR